LKTAQVFAIVIIIAVIGVALGATIGYNLSTGRTSTITQSGNTSMTATTSSGTLFLQSTTITTVTRTTLSFGGSTYATTTGEYSGCIPPVQCYPTTVTTEINGSASPNSTSTTSESSQTSLDTTFTTNFFYHIYINYSGPWTLEYLGTNGTITFDAYHVIQYNVKGYLNGSGDYETTVVTYGVGYVINTLCVTATKLDSQNNLTLIVLFPNRRSTTAPNASVEVCASYGP
jgi:hypothetical protein